VKHVRALAQVVLLSLLYVAFECAARAVGSPIPGGVIGAIALATLLLLGVVPLRWFEDGAKLLLDHLALFFVPAAVAATRSWSFVRRDLLAVTIVAVVTTVLVLVVVGRVAERE
jgi:holin-like protein